MAQRAWALRVVWMLEILNPYFRFLPQQLKTQPVKANINNIYLLAVPKGETVYDAKDDENRVQAAKQERLKNAELLTIGPAATASTSEEDAEKSETMIASLTNRIVDNLQITVRLSRVGGM